MSVIATPLQSASEGGRAAQAPRFLWRLLHKPLAVACVAYLIGLIAVAIIAPIALPNVTRQFAGNLAQANDHPTWGHLLGTDSLGRDVLDRLLVGTRVTLLGAGEAVVVVAALGIPAGLAAGYFGGWFDRLAGWCADLAFSIPAIVILLLVLSVYTASMLAAMVALGVIMAPGMMRVVRATTLAVREEAYIEAARISGLSRRYIITRHVLPRIAGPVIVQMFLIGAVALIVQTGIAYLGLIVAQPAPSWGGMIGDGLSVIDADTWLVIPPGVVTGLTILALCLLGDAARDANAESWSTVVRPTRQPQARRDDGFANNLSVTAGERDDETLLRVENLNVGFRGAGGYTRVVDNVSFDIRSGETVSIVGESGCGKSVTAMAICRVLPGRGEIESGRIAFQGTDLAAISERAMRSVRGKRIAVVSQEPMISLDPTATVGSQIREAVRRHRQCSRSDAHARALELLELVRLPSAADVARLYPHELSGGMAQRVSIARALAGDPELLIADEPTTALDVTVQAEILALLYSLSKDAGLGILLITHDWGVVADLCDRAFVLYAGQVVESGTVATLFARPHHPYTKALLASSPYLAVESPTATLPMEPGTTATPLPAISGTVPSPADWPHGCRFYPRCGYGTQECMTAPIPLSPATDNHQTRCIHYEMIAAGGSHGGEL
jgi:peptide/nickel transport system permease protein